MPLRLKLLVGVIVLVFVGLAVSDVVTFTSLRSFLLARIDQQLVSGRIPMAAALDQSRDGDFGGGGGPHDLTPELPPGTFGEVVDSQGNVLVGPVRFDYGGTPYPAPAIGSRLPSPDGGDQPVLFSTGSTGGSRLRYRVLAQSLDGGRGQLIVAVPLTELTQTLRRLVLVEALVTLAVVVALGFFSWWMVRRELRPLEEIEVTAGAIAAGDLARRVPQDDPRTEVGRLGVSLNAMLTQIEQAFAERRASEERLRRFLADASHELRTPLTSIRGYAELFRRGAAHRQEDLAKSMRRIEDESKRMGVMVDDLLLLARLDQNRPLERVPVDVAAIAADAVEDARAADPGREVTLEAPAPVVVAGDEARLRQVAANLVSNALAHTPAGTPVVVRAVLENDGAVLEVADRGPGLPPEDAARVFEPFYRSDPSRDRATGGAGLGLAIVAAIAHAHGGTVSVGPTRGGGATFTVRLPLVPVETRAFGTALPAPPV